MRITRTLAATIAVVGLTLTACGSSGDEVAAAPAPAAQVDGVAQTAMEATREAGSARTSADVEVSYGEKTYTAALEGVEDYGASSADLTVTTDALGSETQLRQLFVDGVGYLQLPMTPNQWVQIDIGDMALPSGSEDMLESLGSAVDVREVGTGVEDGVAVTNYEGTVDLQQALDTADAAGVTGEKSEDLATKLEASGLTAIPFTFSTDDQGRLVRAGMQFSAESDGKSFSVSASTRWYDFGVETDIAAPPAEQILDIDVEALLGGLSGGFSGSDGNDTNA